MEAVRELVAGEVRRMFADPSGRPMAIDTSAPGLFAPDAVARRVHGDVAGMMIGGSAALLLQMLHPGALAGVWDHSDFRRDMAGRLRRTAAFIAITTYAARPQAEAAISAIRRVHGRVEGVQPDGAPYRANDPKLLGYVHLAGATSFLAAHVRYREPGMPMLDQDRYFAETAVVAEGLGVVDPPRTKAAATAQLEAFYPELRYDARVREAARVLLEQAPPSPLLGPFQTMTMAAAIDLLPGWARRLHRMAMLPARRPLVRAGARAMAGATRWAMAAGKS